MISFPKAILGVPPVLILAFFFLPWITLSCSGEDISTGSAGGQGSGTISFSSDVSPQLLSATGLNLAMGNLSLNENIMGEIGGNIPQSQLPEGMNVQNLQQGGEIPVEDGDYELFLIPLLVFFAGAVVFIADELLKGIYVGAAVVGLLIMLLYWLELRSDMEGQQGVILGYEFGWWLTLAAFILMTVLGMVYDNRAT